MTITLALLAGVILLLPGITALTAWNLIGSLQGAKRPDLQMTSITALFFAVVVALVMHFFGYAVVEVIGRAGSELRNYLPPPLQALGQVENPYVTAIGLALGRTTVTPGALEAFLVTVFIESALALAVVGSDGLGLALEGADLRSQGWVFQHIVRPTRHGYRPIAFVLTLPVQGEYGIGYEGVVADVRQGADGEIRLISLAEPERFIYRLAPVDAISEKSAPALVTADREWIGGVVALDGSTIRNIVVHNIAPEVFERVVDDAGALEP